MNPNQFFSLLKYLVIGIIVIICLPAILPLLSVAIPCSVLVITTLLTCAYCEEAIRQNTWNIPFLGDYSFEFEYTLTELIFVLTLGISVLTIMFSFLGFFMLEFPDTSLHAYMDWFNDLGLAIRNFFQLFLK